MPLSMSLAHKLRGTVSGSPHQAQSLRLTFQAFQITETLLKLTSRRLSQLTFLLAAFHVKIYH